MAQQTFQSRLHYDFMVCICGFISFISTKTTIMKITTCTTYFALQYVYTRIYEQTNKEVYINKEKGKRLCLENCMSSLFKRGRMKIL